MEREERSTASFGESLGDLGREKAEPCFMAGREKWQREGTPYFSYLASILPFTHRRQAAS